MDKYDEVLLPFLGLMRKELHANAGKGDRPGWLGMTWQTSLLEIYYHLGKLQKATNDNDHAGIREYAADVANMSMMLVDICGLLPKDSEKTQSLAADFCEGQWWIQELDAIAPTSSDNVKRAIAVVHNLLSQLPGAYPSRQAMGEAASEWLYTNAPGSLDWTDSRHIDQLLDAMLGTEASAPEYPELAPEDLKIDTYRAGSGGGWAHTTSTAVSIIHLPTGMRVVASKERSQHANKVAALRELTALVGRLS